jgi:hypothetical protein
MHFRDLQAVTINCHTTKVLNYAIAEKAERLLFISLKIPGIAFYLNRFAPGLLQVLVFDPRGLGHGCFEFHDAGL